MEEEEEVEVVVVVEEVELVLINTLTVITGPDMVTAPVRATGLTWR